MAQITLMWALLALALLGLGLGVQRICRVAGLDGSRLFQALWMGFCVAVAFLQIWHFVLPIRLPAFAALVVAGSAGLVWSWRDSREWLLPLNWRKLACAAVCLLLMTWLANLSLGTDVYYDDGLYNLHAVHWNREYAVVPGLANLHFRLGFNNSSHLLAAMLEAGLWRGRSCHLLSGFLLWLFFSQAAASAFGLFVAPKAEKAAHVLTLVLMTPALCLATDYWITSLSTDVPVGIASFAALRQLSLLLVREPDEDPLGFGYALICLVALLAAIVCLKLSALVFAATMGALAVGIWLVRARVYQLPVLRPLFIAAAAGICLLAPWMVHGIILSGYPLFPNTSFGAPVSWRLPSAIAEREWRVMYAWFHFPNDPVTAFEGGEKFLKEHGSSWFGPWLAYHLACPWDRWMLALPFQILPCLALFALLVRLATRSMRPNVLHLLLVPLLLAILAWFEQIPSARHGWALWWMLIAVLAAVLFHGCKGLRAEHLTAVLAACLLLGESQLKRDHLWNSAGPDRGFYPHAVAELEDYRNAAGFVVSVPVESDQCWDGPLVAGPYLKLPENRHVHPRVSEHIDRGFVNDLNAPR